jgi:hypothetical protein
VKKSIVLSVGSVVAASAFMALFGTGVAAADDYAGQTYADASSAASDAGLDVIVASRVGDKVPQDDCVEDTIMFNLNCNAGYATAGMPGPSLASPEGREAKAAADEAAAEEQASLEEVSTPDE